MGVVWKAEDTRLHRQIAIKVLPRELATDPNRRARFEREARAVAALSHPIVVTLHSVERDGEIHFLTMELVDGEPCDHRSDIFSFGSILYEMSTGRRPFAGEGFTQVMSAILQDDPTPFAQIRTVRPEGLQKITLRCLEKDPNRRFQSAKELRDALEELRANPFSETHRFAGAKWVALIAVLAALAVAGWWVASSRSDSGIAGATNQAASVPKPRKIAVLQLRNLGPADDEFFAAVSFTCDAIRGRIGYLQQTVEIDPAFSRAWAMQSQSYSASYAHCSGFADADRAGAKNALMRAEQLAPDTWEVLVAKAQYLTQVERDYARALEPLERAGEQIEAPEVWFAKARIYRRQGRWREALAAFERAAVLNPTNDDQRLSSVHMWLRNYDEAITNYDRDIATAPRVRGRVVAYADNYYLKKAWVYWLWKGTTPEARAVLEELPSTEPSMMIQWGWFWQRIYEGRFQEAIDGLEILLGIRAAKITAPEPPALRRPRRPAGP